MIIDLGVLLPWIGAASTIIGVIAGTYRIIDKHFLKRLSGIDNRLKKIESWTVNQQKDINDSMEEKQLLLQGVLACLEGLKEQGCNGVVTENINIIKNYLFTKAHETKSQI